MPAAFRPSLVCILLLTLPLLAWTDLTPAERRGKQIYLRGQGGSGQEITALMGESGVEVPASVLPCGNCHARDGRGNPEGGVTPTNIQWEALTKPYGVRQAGGREHPPYTLRTLKRAISMGVDPAGNALHVAMPRYRMTVEDMDDLLAYLPMLGQDRDPGVTDDSLRIGTLLPPAGGAEELGRAIQQTLSAFIEDLNSQGGVYSRRLELVSAQLPSEPAQAKESVQRFLGEQQVFALAGAFMAGYEEAVAEAAQAAEVPLIGPFTLDPQLGFPLNREVFYLLAGLAAQGRIAADYMAQRHADSPASGRILHASGPRLEKAAQAVQEQAGQSGWHLEISPLPDSSEQLSQLAKGLSDQATEVVFWLGTADQARAFVSAADRLGWHPEFMAIGSGAVQGLIEAPADFQQRILLTFPTLPMDRKSSGKELHQRLSSRSRMDSAHLVTQYSTLAAAELLKEGLRRCGRDVTRQGLIESLEGLYQHQTGLTPLISYGPNRRIGAQGAYIVSLDLEKKSLLPIGGWRELR